ncbi:MAG: quinoprotein dehydrogenase-associated SoxYZ-like carrier [Gammaproteobacteria bacterium]
MKLLRLFFLSFLSLTLIPVASFAVESEQSEVDVWSAFIKPKHFQDKTLNEGESIIQLNVPYRAEDASVVPISINAQIPQTKDRYIKTVYLFADNNPEPLAGTFRLTPEMGKADLAMRIRIDQYTSVRAVAEMNTGELYMDTKFVRASGGCSLPPPFLELQAAKEHIGEMNFRSVGSSKEEGTLGQLRIRHPNVNGLQLDQRTRSIIPPDYVTKVVISYNDTHIMTAETDISISQDPSFRFFFNPDEDGELKAEMEDSKGRKFSKVFKVNPK